MLSETGMRVFRIERIDQKRIPRFNRATRNSGQPWRLGGNTFSLTCGDLDNDGDMDLMSAEIRHGDTGSASDPSEILLNPTPPGQPPAKFERPGNVKTGIDRPESGIDFASLMSSSNCCSRAPMSMGAQSPIAASRSSSRSRTKAGTRPDTSPPNRTTSLMSEDDR